MNYAGPTKKQQVFIKNLCDELHLHGREFNDFVMELGIKEPAWPSGFKVRANPSKGDASKIIESLLKLKAARIGNQTDK